MTSLVTQRLRAGLAVLLLALLVSAPLPALAQGGAPSATPAGAASTVAAEELEQIVAPIALYPDPPAPGGYYYRLLTAQGPDAPGGAYDYLVRGHLIGGFALVAYPAQWRASGIMTFIVNHDGVVYQKNLGPKTAAIAEAMKRFNPDATWQRVPMQASAGR